MVPSTLRQFFQIGRCAFWLRRALEPFQVMRWAIGGYGIPAPSIVKKHVIRRFIPRGSIFVESGTYLGETSRFFRRRGHDVVTIEVHKPIYDLLAPRLTKLGITALLGDSGTLLPDVLQRNSSHSIFLWLDGHYSAGITGQAPGYETPILKELDAIHRFLSGTSNARLVIASTMFDALAPQPTIRP